MQSTWCAHTMLPEMPACHEIQMVVQSYVQ